jgi:hypothetical protein
MLKRSMCWAAAWLLCTALGLVSANAHDLPVDRIMNGFVKIEPRQADLVIRVPLDLLLGVPFPLAGDHYNIAASGPAVETALTALANAFELWEGNDRLVPSSAAGQLAPLSDRSFEDYDRAVAQVAEPLAPDTVVAFQLGYLDAHFDTDSACRRPRGLHQADYSLYPARRDRSGYDDHWRVRPRGA